MIQIDALSHAIADTDILKDITLTLPKGGITAIVGPNGAGKSMLMSHIARLIPIQTGRITIDDLPIGETPDPVLARKLAILPQKLTLSTRLTVRELVSFGRFPHSQGRLTAQDQAKIDEALEVFALTDLAHRQLDTLSGGQQQRATLAMTFAQDTDYLLLDEPLNNLDLAATKSLMATLQSLTQDHGKSILIVIHDLNTAARYANHMLALKNGTVAASGRPTDLVASSFLSSVFAVEAQVHQLNGYPIVLM